MKIKIIGLNLLLAFGLLWGCSLPQQEYDLIIRNGMVYDGSGKSAVKTDIGINADTIAFIGDLSQFKGKKEIDAKGLAVAPGFINMLSWATESLLIDGNSQSDIRQGVTLEVFGEGTSMGPLSEKMKEEYRKEGGDFKYENQWTTLGEYLTFLEKKGVACNVASFMGATTARIHVLGYQDRKPTEEELKKMQDLVRQAMEEGALGVGSSLIYAPAFYAKTDELIALCKVAAEYDGLYISHLRSEGNSFEKAVDELLTIAKEAGIRAEIYHLKAAGKENWHKIDKVIAKIDSARKAGLEISTDMYTYIAGATGLDAAMPPWVQEGGYEKWAERLQKPEIRKKVIQEMKTPTNQWENLYLGAGSPENVLLIGFKNDSLKYLTGKTLAEVAKIRGKSPEETAIDLVVQDGSRVGTAYFMMSEENVRKQIALPYMSFGSDAESLAPEGSFLKYNPHPRAYGNVARLLGKYVREEKIIPLEEAIRKLTSLSAEKLRIKKRALLKEGYFADIVIFDADKIQDHATFEKPHRYATGMVHVFVNGVQVLKDGEHTGAKPGRFVKREK
ncbi:N-acyl-D-amino-acid deacylase family protein [Thermoflexibacter ruber]|uniref:N-acyl-D-amino-acid deacylase n=1 Tax=Thermoflexibacter ruber TaxID=1003 RepID=A0A1I2H507_9BACT|nr:D-aminoacylase [Thermoflexibacter ruber]SFF25264.1 N-acyl-D-amino-acid deacylase [Thermoflexibacter ruber]